MIAVSGPVAPPTPPRVGSPRFPGKTDDFSEYSLLRSFFRDNLLQRSSRERFITRVDGLLMGTLLERVS